MKDLGLYEENPYKLNGDIEYYSNLTKIKYNKELIGFTKLSDYWAFDSPLTYEMKDFLDNEINGINFLTLLCDGGRDFSEYKYSLSFQELALYSLKYITENLQLWHFYQFYKKLYGQIDNEAIYSLIISDPSFSSHFFFSDSIFEEASLVKKFRFISI